MNEVSGDKQYVLIIYDIVDNRQRSKLAKFLKGFGFRVQKSAFEGFLKEKSYYKLLAGINQFVKADDNIRVYKLGKNVNVVNYGKESGIKVEDVIVI